MTVIQKYEKKTSQQSTKRQHKENATEKRTRAFPKNTLPSEPPSPPATNQHA